MPKPSIVISKEQAKRLLQRALALPENQKKITATAAKRYGTRVDRVYQGLLGQAGQTLKNPTMTENSQTVRFRELTGFDDSDYPIYRPTSFNVNWPKLAPAYSKRKPAGTKGVFWKKSGRTAAAYAGAIKGVGRVSARTVKVRLAKDARLSTETELQIPSLPWPLNDLFVRPFVYGSIRTPAFSFNGYRGGLATLMFLERPYGTRSDISSRQRRYVAQLTGRKGKALEKALAARDARRSGGAPARPWLRQLASTFRRDMIRALAGR